MKSLAQVIRSVTTGDKDDLNEARKKKNRMNPAKPTGFRILDKVEANGEVGYIRKLDKNKQKAEVEINKERKTFGYDDLKLLKTAGGVKVNEQAEFDDLEESKKKDTDVDKDKEGTLDPVKKDQLKHDDVEDREDDDLDNDGDTDNSDQYLHTRRKAITKAIEKQSKKDES